MPKKCMLTALLFLFFYSSTAQPVEDFKYQGGSQPGTHPVLSSFQFNGYTRYWQDQYKNWIRYGSFFKLSQPDVTASIIQNKIDIAEELGVPGLWMQEGFFNELAAAPFGELYNPSKSQLEKAAQQQNVLVYLDSASALQQQLTALVGQEPDMGKQLQSHQYNAENFQKSNAFFIEKDGRKIFVISAAGRQYATRLKSLITNALGLLSQYELHKGWFGAETLLKSVTITPGHPLEVIGRGMNEGNDWFVFSGYMDFLMQDELKAWMKEIPSNVVTDVGFSPIYGLQNYEGLQVQDMGGEQKWIDYAHGKKGYVFRPVYDTSRKAKTYDGYIATAGNKEQIDNEAIPFVLNTGPLIDGALSSMVLFTKKGEAFSREKMWEAILQRKAVGILPEGKMIGPEAFRSTLQLLLLDRVYPEKYFGDRISIQPSTNGYALNINLSNTSDKPVNGTLKIQMPAVLQNEEGKDALQVQLPAHSNRTVTYKIRPTAAGMDRANPILIQYEWDGQTKNAMSMLNLPPAISVHRLLYGNSPVVSFPVSVHNFTSSKNFPVSVEVFKKGSSKPVFSAKKTLQANSSDYAKTAFDLKLPAGSYDVKVVAMGTTAYSQLGVGARGGTVTATAVDLNGDEIDEYRLENDSVQVTLLATGARVIEYIVKSRQDNVLFKLWPDKPEDDKREFRKHGFYPYGGFEDFLGQGSMETHKVYDAKLVKDKGDYVQVVMTADYYGNRLEKTFTLYGNSPLLEVRYALNFISPDANVIGPQPILEIGKVHGPEDLFVAPDKTGMLKIRMRPEEYFGRVINLKEGWNAGYDENQDIAFIGAFPVTQPLFLHMWMNHPRNSESHYYYAEFQPWVPIIQKNTMYFSYYLWAEGGSWEHALQSMRQRNLISER